MKKLILGLVLALLPQIALAEYILKGPHTTVETDGSQTDGSVNLITKNAGPINFYTDNVLRSSISSTGTTSYVGGLQCGGNLTFTGDTSVIARDDAVGYLGIGGGISDSNTAGGHIQLFANTHATSPGYAFIGSGGIANSILSLDGRGDGAPPLRLRTSATAGGAMVNRWGVENDGDFAQDATNGGNITMAKAGTSLIAGGAATVTGMTGAPVEVQANGSSTNALKIVGYSATAADGPYIAIGRTKGAAAATNTLVASGDVLGSVTFGGANGTSYTTAAEIRASVDGTPGASNDMPGALNFYTTPDGSGSQVARFKLENDGDFVAQSTGNIIVGTSALNADITGTAAGALHSLSSTSENNLILQQASADTAGTSIYTFKSRAVDGSADTVVNSGDTLFLMRAYGSDGAAFARAAEISILSDGTPGSGDMPGAIRFSTSPDGSATPATTLTLSSAGTATFTGPIVSTRSSDLGWAVVDGADNTACTSQCTAAAIFGFNLAAGATAPVIVGATDATADICLCAGGS